MKKSQEQKELPENDHRALGQKLGLFSFHDIAPGAPFWHHNGMIIFRELEKYARKINDENGYEEVSTPILVKKELFEKSGHWEHYRDNMFWFKNPRDAKEVLALKSMNCPESMFVYNSSLRSYKDLPLRLAEIGRLHRNERSGTLGGLLRVRQITMDDAHIFVRPDQAVEEIKKVLAVIKNFYDAFGFKTGYVLATKPKKALGTPKDWKLTETALATALKEDGIPHAVHRGEGAFYGPKVEVHISDSQNRDWQLGTVQLDTLMLPKRLALFYIDERGKKQMPWVIHRAIFGSFERFIGILLEHFKGSLPVWLSPIQATILPIGEKQTAYAEKIFGMLKKEGIRVKLRGGNDTLQKRIRETEIQRIPYLVIVGEREESSQTIALRARGRGDQGQLSLDTFFDIVKKELLNY